MAQHKKPAGTKYKPFCGRDRSRLLFNQYLEQAELGDIDAARLVFDRIFPKLKPITPMDSLDAEYLQAKIKQVAELEERIAALEENQNED